MGLEARAHADGQMGPTLGKEAGDRHISPARFKPVIFSPGGFKRHHLLLAQHTDSRRRGDAYLVGRHLLRMDMEFPRVSLIGESG